MKPVLGWILTQMTILAGYSPWFPTLFYQSRHGGHGAEPVSPFDALTPFATATVSLPLLPALILGLAFITAAIWIAIRSTAMHTSADRDRELAILLFLLVPFGALAAATVLSRTTFLLQIRCLLTIAPCLLLTMAYGIALAPTVLRGVSMGSLSIVYLVYSMSLFGHVKSDAREVAAAMAVQVRPSDLILIEPGFILSSFNYYYDKRSERIALFPSGCKEERLASTILKTVCWNPTQ